MIGSELAVVQWLGLGLADLTGNFYLAAVLPVHFLVQGLIVSLTAPLMRARPAIHIGIYAVTVAGVYVAMLRQFFNPWADVVVYLLIAAATMAVWLAINKRRIFRPA